MKLGKKTILLVGLPVGLAVAGGLAFMTLSGGGSKVPPKTPDPKVGQHGFMLALDERVVNLKPGAAGSFRYAKVGLTVEIRPATAAYYDLAGAARTEADKELIAEHTPDVPLLLDALGTVVAAEDAATLTDPKGRTGLKTALLEEVRHILGEEEVLDIYFTDLVMQ